LELPIPLLKNKDNIDPDYIDQLLRERKIDEVLDIIDQELLVKQLGLSQKTVDSLRSIWLKLSDRRMARKKR
jgi:adenine-specific DNA-methyltransferase